MSCRKSKVVKETITTFRNIVYEKSYRLVSCIYYNIMIYDVYSTCIWIGCYFINNYEIHLSNLFVKIPSSLRYLYIILISKGEYFSDLFFMCINLFANAIIIIVIICKIKLFFKIWIKSSRVKIYKYIFKNLL